MIKNLRSIFMVALMAVSGSMFAQGTTEPKGEVIDFVATFSKIEKADNTDKNGHEFVYLEKHAIEQNGISVVFAKATGSSAPSFKIKDAKTGNADKFIKLFGGALSGENKGTDGNTMTFKAEKNITKISIAASNADQYGTIKANCGTVEMTGANPDAKPARPAIDVLWTNVEGGKTIDVKEVVFTICRDAKAEKYEHVRYGSAIVFTADGAATGINNITAAKAQNGVRYNLAGQRVSKDFKGVVIENGKKMIVK